MVLIKTIRTKQQKQQNLQYKSKRYLKALLKFQCNYSFLYIKIKRKKNLFAINFTNLQGLMSFCVYVTYIENLKANNGYYENILIKLII